MRKTLTLFFACLTLALPAAAQEKSPEQQLMEDIRAFCGNPGALDPTEVILKLHIVQPDQSLGDIARWHSPDGNTGKCLGRLNIAVLAPKFAERCTNLERDSEDGFYCNRSLGNANYPAEFNTVKPGDEVYFIAAMTNPAVISTEGLSGDIVKEVNIAVGQIEGDEAVLLIDVSGSMNEASDRAKASALYGQLLGDRLAGVVFYSQYAHFVPASELEADIFASWNPALTGNEKDEHVLDALQLASQHGTAGVLVGDESGVDTSGANFTGLGIPITTHCLRDPQQDPCFSTFQRIADETGGTAVGQS